MATIDLPGVEEGRNAKETITNLFDAYIKLRRTVEHALLNLDSRNIKELDANLVRIKNLKAEMIVSNTIITNFLYALDGRIARLTVDHLLTEDVLSGASKLTYVDIKDQCIRLIEATRNDAIPQVQYTLEDETTLLYWKDATETEMTTTETAWPVMVYQYDKLIKAELSFSSVGGTMTPRLVLGAGTGTGDNGKAILYKDEANVFHIQYIHSTTGATIEMTMDNNGIHISGLTGIPRIWVSATEPVDAVDGDIWIDTDDYSRYDIKSVSASTTVTAADGEYVELTGTTSGQTLTITSPGATGGACVKHIRNSSTQTWTIAATIDGTASPTLPAGASIIIIWNNTDWRKVASHTPGYTGNPSWSDGTNTHTLTIVNGVVTGYTSA